MLYHNWAGVPVGRITNIQRYTIHDGPGIRTELFFKGCTMHCLWCSNPETIRPNRELGFYPSKCMTKEKCAWCVKACAAGGTPLLFDDDGLIAVVDGEKCLGCFHCSDECPNHAIKSWGEDKTVEELMKIILADESFYRRTGGGVTLNGGEVLLQWEFARMLLRACKENNINTCVESALCVPTEHMEAVLEYTDLLICDIKHMDSAIHKKLTGQPNEQILKNIRRAAGLGKKLVVRTPVVQGYNADEENIRKTGEFLKTELGGRIVAYQLLPYRRMGTEKYESLRRPYPFEDYQAPEREQWEKNLLALAALLREEYGLPAVAGSGEKLRLDPDDGNERD